jgi:hypothetical protein
VYRLIQALVTFLYIRLTCVLVYNENVNQEIKKYGSAKK